MAKNSKTARRQTALIETLEPRLLYSADVMSSLADLNSDTDDSHEQLQKQLQAFTAFDADDNDGLIDSGVPDANYTTHEIVFVGANIDDVDALVADMLGNDPLRSVEVIVLDPQSSAIEQISAALANRSDLDGIHLFAHGDAGVIDFGSEQLDLLTIAAHREALSAWSTALDEDADLLIYGCNLAGSEDGLALVQQLALLTGADVAASDDLTGAASLGGDWELEITTGAIEISMAVSAEAQAQWTATLATFTVSNLNATGIGSLDWAISQANSSGGVDTINFSVSGTIFATSGYVITQDIIIDGTDAPGYGGAPVIEIDGSAAGAQVGFTFNGANNSVMQGLNVHSFDSGLVTIASSDVDIIDNYLGTNLAGTAIGGSGITGHIVNIESSGQRAEIIGNVISGGNNGINVDSADFVIIQGNYIGTDAAGSTAIANVHGIVFSNDVKDGLIGTDGDTINDAAEANLISGNSADGIRIEGAASDRNTIAGNFIGTDASGTAVLGNGDEGIVVTDSGKETVIVDNVISGNAGEGILYITTGNDGVIQGNYIGTDVSGTIQLGNLSAGIFVNSNARVLIGGLAPGEGNVIAFNGIKLQLGGTLGGGVTLGPTATDKIEISGNVFYGNYGPDIDLNQDGVTPNDPGDGDNGPNTLLNNPELGSAVTNGAGTVTLSGDGSDLAGGTFTIQVYASANHNDWRGEGARLLFTDTITGGSPFVLNAVGVSLTPGEYVSAILIDANGNTSEFSEVVVATHSSGNSAPADLTVTGTPQGGVSLNEDGGDAGYLYADNGGTIFGGLTAYTIEARFEFSDTGSAHTLLSYASFGATDEDLRVTLAASGDLVIVTGSSSITTSGFDFHALADGNPHTLSVSWDNSGALNVYVDGDLKYTTTGFAVGTTIASGGHLIIGQDQNGINNLTDPTQAFNGTIYELRVFDSVQSAADIAEFHGVTVPFDTANLVASWDFDDLSVDGVATDAVTGNNLNTAVYTNIGWTPSTPQLVMTIAEDADVGMVVGEVAGIDADRDAQIAALLAANPNLVYSAETDTFYEVLTLGSWTVAEAAASSQLLGGIGGQLVVIHSAHENNTVVDTLTAGGVTIGWIGATDQSTEAAWYWRAGGADDIQFWQGDGTGFSVNDLYQNWIPGDPNAGVAGNHAVIQTTGLWYDRDETNTTLAVVEWDANVVLNAAEALLYTFAPGGDAGGAFAIDATTGVITVADPSLLDYETASTMTVTVRVTDDDGASYDEAFDIELLDAGNEASISLPAPQAGDEDVGIIFSAANGNAVTVDSGGPYNPAMTVTLSVANGTLTLATTAGITFLDGTNDGEATITIIGLESDLNAALDGLSYVPTMDYFGSDTLNVSTGSTAPDLVGAYDFESGSLLDISGNGNDAMFVNGNANPMLQIDSQRGDVFAFDGDDYLEINGHFGTSQTLTLAAWVNLDAGQTDAVVISLGDHVVLTLDTIVGVALRVGSSSLGGLANVAGMGWHHVAATIDSVTGNLSVYLDGELINAATGSFIGDIDWGTAPQANSAIGDSFGTDIFTDNPMVGQIDDARIYDRVLTPNEIALLAGNQNFTSGSVALTVNPVNDEQTLDVNLGQTVNEGSSVVISAADLDTNDIDNTPAQIVYTVTSVPGNGQLELTTAPGVAITSFTQADIDGGLLIFVHDGSETTTDSFDFSVDDGQGTTSFGTFNLTVTPVNDEQTLDVNLGQSVNEGSSVSITASELDTNDADNTPAQVVYTVTSVPANGQLELTTAPGVAITSFTQADIDGGLLVFVHDGSETTTDSFDFSVDDGQGAVSTGTFSITVNPVNDEQTLDVNLGQTGNEGSSIAITAAVLDTNDVDNTPSQVVYTVTTIPVNGQLELTTAPGVAITSFTQADIDGGLLVFVHDGSETTTDSFNFSVDDGQGTVSTGTFNLAITPVNDEQTLDVNLGQTVNEGASIAITAAVLDTNDVDNTPAQIIYTVTTAPSNGQLELTTAPGVAITSFTQADVDGGLLVFVHDGSETTTDSFDFSVDDGQGAVSTGTFSITINPVNDEQTLDVNLGQTINEGATAVITAAILDTNDVDNTPAQVVYTVTAVPANGQLELTTAPGVAITSFTQADIDGGLLVFVHDGSETTTDSFDFSVDDGQGAVSTGTFNITINPVNDEQTLDVNLGETVNEGGSVGIAAVVLDTNDVDNTPVQIVYTITSAPANGQLELTTAPGVAITSFTQADIDGGLLIFVHDGSETTTDSFDFSVDDGQGAVSTGTFNITVNPVNDEQTLDVNLGETVNEGGSVGITAAVLDTNDADNTPAQIVYTVTSVPVNGQLELTTAPGVAITSFTQADIDGGLLVFVHDGSETTTDSFDFSVDDGQGAVSTGTFNITVNPVNDEQTLDVNLGETVNEGGSVGITAAVLDTNDVDNTPVQIVYTVTSVPANGQLELTTAPGVAITSFTQADIDGGLLIFVHDGSETTTDSFDFSVDDGQGAVSTGTFNITVNLVNDEQTLDVNLGETVNEGGSVGITAAVLDTNDADNTPAQVVYTVTSVPANGQLELTTAPGVAITSFTQADIDGGLLIFVHDGSETTTDSFDFSVDDGQGAVSTGTFNITVNPVNDEQTLDINLGETVNEGGSVGITAAVLDTNDVDNTPAQIVYTVTSVPANGQLELTTAPGVAITSFTQADIDGGLLVFVHDGSETTTDSFDFSVDDGQGAVSTGTFNLTITPVNDEQTLDVNLGETVNEGGSVGITAAVLDTNDVDNTPAQIVYTVTSVPVNGQLELTTAPGVAITSFTQADIDGGLLVFVHDGSETTTDSFDFSVDDGQGAVSTGTFNLTITPVNDEQTLDVNLGETVNEGGSVGITAAVLDTNDVDNTPAQIVYTVTSVPVNGQLELTTAPGVAITSFTQADIDGGLLIFVHDGSETTTDSFDFSVDDGQGTVSTGTFNITVNPVNDEQTLDVNLGETVNEGGSVGITAAVLDTNDADNTPVQVVYTVTSVPANGQLELTTAPGVAITSFTQADIDGGLLIFVHDGSETTTDSFDFSVDDGQGAVSTGTFNLTVTPVNDEQTLDVNLGETVNEGGSIGITAAVLDTNDVDNTANQIVYTVTSVPANGQLELTTAPGVAITSFTQADIDGGLLVFVHDGSETTTDSFDFSVDDGQGAVSTGTFNITVNPVNDEQTLDVNLGATLAEGGSVSIDATVLDTNDVDNTPAQIVYTVTSVPTNGQLELTTAPGVAITSFTQADIDGGLLVFVHDGSETTTDSFDFSVDDGQGAVSTGTFNLTITPVNDEQTLDVNLGETVNEGGSVGITAAVLDTNDVDNAPAQIVYTVTSVPVNGQLELTTAPGVAITSFTQADIDGGLLVFVHDGSETTTDSFDFSVDDGQGAVSTGTFNITVNPVNDEQTLDVNLGETVNEGSSVGITAAVLDTNDVDNTTNQIVYTVTSVPANGQLELTTAPGVAITSFTQADIDGGLLVFVHDGSDTTTDSFDFSVDDGQGAVSTGTFNLTITPVNDEQTLDVNLGETVNEGGSVGITAAVLDTNDVDNTPVQIVYTVTSVPTNGQLELTTAPGVAITSFTQADIDGGLLVFVHDGSETTTDSFDFSVDDGQGAVSTGTFNLTITPVNDEQTLDVNLGATLAEGGSVSIDATVLETNDVDNTPNQIVYTVTSVPANGQLELTTAPGVAITSFTQADIDGGLLVFVHDGSDTTTDSFDFSVDDGQGAVSTGTFNLTITPVNDEQTLDVNLGETVNEGGSVGITAAVLDTNDVDNTPVQIVYTVTSVPTNGQLELTTAPGVAITSFTQADIDGGLLVFVHDGSETTTDSFDFSVDDGQGAVSTGTFNITVNPVNDEQTLDVNLGETVNEGGSVGITAAVLDTNDVDNTPAQIVYTVTAVPANGQLELTTAPGVAITSFTQADIDGGLLVFIHDGSETTTDSFDFSVDDGQGTVSTGTFNLTITPVNDEQTLDINLGETVNEGGSVGITAAVLDTNDADNTPAQIVYTVTSVPANGQLELTTAPGVAITSFTQADIDGGLLIFVHDGSETTTDSFDFSVDDGQGAVSTGTFNITVNPVNDEQTLDVNLVETVNEGGAVGITATVLDTNDVDNTPNQIVYTVTSIPANGQLELTTAPGVAITSFTQADIDGGLLVFVHNGSDTTTDSFDFSVDDGQGAVSTGTFNLTITPVNDEQTLDVNLGATLAEGGSVSIDATVLDTNDVDNTPAQIVYTVTSVPANGQLELTTAPGVAITSFTQADIDGGLLVFIHDGSETTTDSFDFSVDDGQGAVSTGTFNLTITPVNDEQTLDVNLGATLAEGGSVSIDATVLDTNDVDNTPAQIVYTVTSVPTNGQLELTTAPGVAITSFTQADIDGGLLIFVHDGSETTTDSFDFSVDDGQGAVSTGTFNLTITPVNDEQTLDVNLGATLAEGGSVSIDATVLDTNDVDNTPAQIVYTVTSVPANGQLELTTAPGVAITSFTQADIDGGLLVFIHDGSETTTDSFDFSVDDGQGAVSTGTFNLTITPVNDEQTLDVNLGATLAEGGSVSIDATVLDTNDVDNTPNQIVYTVTSVPANGQLELTTAPGVAITSFTQADIDGGLLVFVHDGSETTTDSFDFSVDDGQGAVSTGTFNLTITPVNDEQTLDVNLGATLAEGGSVSIDATVLDTNDVDNTPAQIVYTVTSVPVNGQLELTTAPGVAITSFTQADIDGGLLVFIHDGSETTTDSFDFSVDDGQGAVSTGTFNLTITPVNDEQTLDVNLGATLAEGGSVSIDATVLDTNDVDNTPAQIVYTVTSVPTNGQLELTTAPGVAITSFTQADIDGGLLVFIHDGSDTTTDSFDFSVDDGQGAVSTGTFNLTITPVNDEQTLDVNLGATLAEGGSVSIDATVLDTNDVDNTPAQIVYTVTSVPVNGQLELTTSPGVAITSFTQADIDGGLLVFVHDGSETTTDSFDFSVDDGQGAVSTGTFNLTVTPVNDEQTLDINLGETVNEGGSVGITAAVLDTNDADNTPAQIVYTVTSVPANGQLELTTAPGVAITSFTQADIDGGLVNFVHDGSETTTDSFDFLVDDGQGTLSSGTFGLTVNAVNDAPVIGTPGLPLEATEQTLFALHGRGLTISDVDSGTNIITVTLSVTNGTLTVAPAGTALAGVSGNNTGFVTIQGTITTINELLAGANSSTIEYYNASDTPPDSVNLTMTVDDQGGGGLPGPDGQSDAAILPVQILAVDDAPVIVSNGGAPQVLLTAAENSSVVAQVTASDVDTSQAGISYAIVGGDDASRFVVDNSGQVSFLSPPQYDLPVDIDGDNIYQVVIAASDGTSTAVQELVISVTETFNLADNPATVKLIGEPVIADTPDTEDALSEEEDPLADALAALPVNDMTIALATEAPNSLRDLAPPSSIVIDDAVVDSIAPNDRDNPTRLLPDASTSLVRELLLSGTPGPAKFAFQLATEAFDDGLSNPSFVDGLDNMRRELDKARDDVAQQSEIISSVAAGATATLTVGIIGWILRAGSMIATFLTSAPLWRHLDPLSIVGGRKSQDKDEDVLPEANTEDRKLDHLFRRGSGGQK